ncbi:DUF4097 domain-containing protein [Sphingobacterium hotanense]|uniref:DUF4097 domain-containing protein n=1 Tax=Sphingobacterium hotanense TaxID=649196 RepID=UPI0021A6E0C5|nr:DUF4097 domain-containing protein [Sphingobacterium hotanense]MCT1526110.1 DUF4097 domain-containing protein [Sphingobacterium hotanense]
MKTKMFAVILMAIFTVRGYSQTVTDGSTGSERTFSLSKNGKVKIELGKAVIEGHSESSVIVTSLDSPRKADPRADGLVQVNGLGLPDNTGLGINVSQENGTMVVRQLDRIDPPNIKILVPEGCMLSYDHQSPHGSNIVLKNLKGEVEMSTNHNDVRLENVTGPITLTSIHGDVDAIFGETVKGPVSIVSVHGHVDVSLPGSLRANLKMATKYGELLLDPELQIDIESQGKMIRYNNQIGGKMNGGSDTNIDLRSDHGKIYLRKK